MLESEMQFIDKVQVLQWREGDISPSNEIGGGTHPAPHISLPKYR